MNKDELKKKLNPSNVKSRSKGGTTLSYIEGWKTIEEANEIFDFDGWSRETVYNREITRVDVRVGKGDYAAPGFKVGYEAKITVTVGDVRRDGTGHGSQTSKDLFDAIEGAAKEAETDAMKRALMTFGNRFGLALYDKTQKNVGVDVDHKDIAKRLMVKVDGFKISGQLLEFEKDSQVYSARAELPKNLSKEVDDRIKAKHLSFNPSPSQAEGMDNG